MNRLRFLLPTFAAGLIVLLAGHPVAQAQNSATLLRRLQTKYDALQSLQASFTQTMTSEYMDGPQRFTGRLVMQREKYRVETGAQTIVTDGRTMWIFNSAENQVLVNDYVQDETSFSINDFFRNFDELYNVRATQAVTLSGKKHFKMELRPKRADSFFKAVTLWMRDSDDVITRVEVLDANDVKMVFELTNIVLNPAVNGSTFQFTPPRGAEVVDLRS
jgi:chaperone LolA